MDVILIDLCAPCHADSDTNTLSDESDKLRQLLREQTDAKQSLQARILELQNELTLKLEALKSAEGELKSKVSQVADLEEGINRIITENEKLTRDNEVLQEEIAVMTAAVAPALNNKNCASDTIGTLPQVRREAVKGVRGAIHTGPLAGSTLTTNQPTNQPTNEPTGDEACVGLVCQVCLGPRRAQARVGRCVWLAGSWVRRRRSSWSGTLLATVHTLPSFLPSDRLIADVLAQSYDRRCARHLVDHGLEGRVPRRPRVGAQLAQL